MKVTVTDHEIEIRCESILKQDGYTQHLEPLYRTLHKLRDKIASRRLRLVAFDIVPFKLVSFDNVLKYLAEIYGLSKDRIILQTRPHTPPFTSDVATIDSSMISDGFVLARNWVKADSCLTDTNAKLFGAQFGRFTTHRFLMAHFLETKIKDHSVVIFRPSIKTARFDFEGVKEYFVEELQWLENRPVDNVLIASGFRGGLGMEHSCRTYHEIFGMYRIEIVSETNFHECGWFSEKIPRCLVSGKPFLLLGTPGQLAELRQLGFKTFDPFIDESYDQESNPDKRFDMITTEIERLAGLPPAQLNNILENLDNVAQYNKKNYVAITDNYYVNQPNWTSNSTIRS